MNLSGIGTEGVIAVVLYIIVKDGLIPLIKKMNGRNKIGLEKFYQEWNDFKLETFQNYKNEVKERCDKRGGASRTKRRGRGFVRIQRRGPSLPCT